MNCIRTIAKNLAKPVFNWLKRKVPRVTEVITQKRIADVIRFTIEFTIDLLFLSSRNPICVRGDGYDCSNKIRRY